MKIRARYRLLLMAVIAMGTLTIIPALAESQAHFDPRAYTSLDQVIMLCATAPASDRFDQAWLQWLEANPGVDVDSAVDTVISRSGTLRSMAIPGLEPAPRGRKPDTGAIAEHMRSLARSRAR